MIEPQSIQDGASAWFTKLPTRFSEAADADADEVVASPDPPAIAPAAWGGVAAVSAAVFAASL
jgi:hypothetical protein